MSFNVLIICVLLSVSFLGQFQWIDFSPYDGLCFSDCLNARQFFIFCQHCKFYFVVLQILLCSCKYSGACFGVQLSCLETV